MIIHYLNVMRLAVTPDEANSPPIVYPNAMLTSSVALERLKAVARRNAKLLQLPDGVKVQQLTPARALDGPKPGTVWSWNSASVLRHRNDRIKIHSMTGRVFRQT